MSLEAVNVYDHEHVNDRAAGFRFIVLHVQVGVCVVVGGFGSIRVAIRPLSQFAQPR